jgi:hypothetical protein
MHNYAATNAVRVQAKEILLELTSATETTNLHGKLHSAVQLDAATTGKAVKLPATPG